MDGQKQAGPDDKTRCMIRPNSWAAAVLVLGEGSVPINCLLVWAAERVKAATATLHACLTRQDWEYLYLSLEAVASQEHADPRWGAVELRGELADAKALRGLDEQAWTTNPGECCAALLKWAAKWDDVTAYAALLAVRHAVRIPDLDRRREDWWTVEHRHRASLHTRRRA